MLTNRGSEDEKAPPMARGMQAWRVKHEADTSISGLKYAYCCHFFST